jgi:hypothetical protein
MEKTAVVDKPLPDTGNNKGGQDNKKLLLGNS